MNIALYIARRLAQSTSENRPGLMVRIATIAVALSLSVMLISISVILGFKVEITRRIVGFAAEIEVTDIRSTPDGFPHPISPSEELERLIKNSDNILSISKIATRNAIIRTEESIEGVQLKGIGPDYDRSFLETILREGSFPHIESEHRTKELLLSQTLASRLQIEVGDKIELLFLDESGSPHRDRFKISGLYHSGMEEVDRVLLFADIRDIQRLNGWENGEISGYEVRLNEAASIEAEGNRLNVELLYSELDEAYNVVAKTIADRYPIMFDWLLTHNVNAAVILTIMFLVALFNMISVLLILVLERTRMIGLLKALGMNNGRLRELFLYRALFIILKGVCWGNLIALALCLTQKWGHVLKLDSSGYMLSEVPIELDGGSWLLINVGCIALILLLLAIPASLVGRIRPEQTIRYE